MSPAFLWQNLVAALLLLIDTLAVLLEAECLHRDSLAHGRRMKLAKLSQRAHPADVDLRSARGLGKSRGNRCSA